MTNIYNLEPQAFGSITFKTTFGDLELELFTKQCPKNTRNFVQLCLDGYYDGTVFERVEKDFIAIGGERDGSSVVETGTSPDEFHQRLKFTRRGLLATANTEKNLNGPKFFFTLGAAPELQNKHTIFGRLVGDSVYYLVDLNDCQVNDDMRPISEKKVLKVIVSNNPYPELTPRLLPEEARKESEPAGQSPKSDYLEPKFDFKKHAKKLAFYEDSDDDVQESDQEAPANELKAEQSKDGDTTDNVAEPEGTVKIDGKDPEEQQGEMPESQQDDREAKLREIREQIRKLKQKLENESATKIRTLSDRRRESLGQGSSLNVTQDSKTDLFALSNLEDPDQSGGVQEVRLATKKGRQRERETIELMQQFKKKLKESSGSKHKATDEKATTNSEPNGSDEETELALELADGDDWMHHRFDAKNTSASLAKDANTKGDDWYSIDDPRNPMVGRVESERAREYKRHKDRDRDRHSDGHERERRRHSDHRSSRHHHR